MPRAIRSSTRATAQRRAPYASRSASTTGQSSTMAIAVSPMVTVPMWDSNPTYYLDEQQQQSYGHYQQATMHNHYTALPTPLSGAPPVQHIRAASLPIASSQANNNGNGPWTLEMDDILVEMAGRLKWDQIAEQFFRGTKTGNACRKRYARLKVERAEPARWEPARIQKVITAYNREGVRERMWRSLAEELGEKWQDVERCVGPSPQPAVASN